MKPPVQNRVDSRVGPIFLFRQDMTWRKVFPFILSGMMITLFIVSTSYGADRSRRCRCKPRVRVSKQRVVRGKHIQKRRTNVKNHEGSHCTDFEDSVTPSKTPMPPVGDLTGHAEDYSWLIGQLQRVHIPKPGWKIRYLPLDQKDRWGGSVVLAPDIRIESFQHGDRVYVEGKILARRASLYLSGPRYRASTIRLANDGDPNRTADSSTDQPGVLRPYLTHVVGPVR